MMDKIDATQHKQRLFNLLRCHNHKCLQIPFGCVCVCAYIVLQVRKSYFNLSISKFSFVAFCVEKSIEHDNTVFIRHTAL